MRICSFTFEQLSTRVKVSYRNKVGNKYAGQDRPLASKLASESAE
jgi:dCTP deaminase